MHNLTRANHLLAEILSNPANSNSEPDVMGEALDQIKDLAESAYSMLKTPTITEAEEERRGKLIAQVLRLRTLTARSAHNTNDIGRYRTTWGTKTALGLYRIVQRIVEEGE